MLPSLSTEALVSVVVRLDVLVLAHVRREEWSYVFELWQA